MLEYVRGCSLDIVIKNKPLATNNSIIKFIFSCVLKALSYLHSNKIIHRDLKPHNIIVREDWSAVLSDYGIIKAIADKSNLPNLNTCSIGTPVYMAPEVHSGD